MPDDCPTDLRVLDLRDAQDVAVLQRCGLSSSVELRSYLPPSSERKMPQPAPAPTPAPVPPVVAPTPVATAPVVAPVAVTPLAVGAPPVAERLPGAADVAEAMAGSNLPATDAAQQTTAHEAQPDPTAPPSADDLTKLVDSAGGNPMLALGLVVVTVIGGGGAAWKYVQQRGKASAELAEKQAEQAHELEMKRLELQSKSQPDYSTQQPPPCVAASVAVESRISALDSKVSSVDNRLGRIERDVSASFSPGGPSIADLDERLAKVERTLKSKPKAGAK
jgi:hypothetical protein